MRGQPPSAPFSASTAGGGVVAMWGGWGGIVKISSHHSSQEGCRAVGDGDWEVLIVKLYVKH